METRQCQNCKKDFIIEPDDFSFYEKIKVPPPTFCPECRMIRRMMWRNCRSLFRRPCGSCGKNIISMYAPDKIYNVYCMDCWTSDKRDPFLYGVDYDFSQNFFKQINKLLKETPILYVHHTGTLVRSDFTNYSVDNKDCYLSYSVVGCENILYSENIDKSKNNLDCYSVQKVENCSYNIDCDNNYNCHYAIQSQKCIDSFFIYDCINCQNCCLSSNLRNKQYVFKNKKLKKEEYEEEFLKLMLGTYKGFEEALKDLKDIIKNKTIHRYAQVYNSQNAIGDYIGNSKNIINSYVVQNSENIHYGYRVLSNSKDSYDCQGLASGELIYESVATSFSTSKDYFSYICVGSKECEYSFMCKNCSNCFACFGLTNSKYCIFNKQYDKKEYFELVEKIKKHMDEMPYIDSKGRVYKYGEFFPYELCPFGYNETNANEYFHTTKDDSILRGYPWKDREEKDYHVTIMSEDLLDSIKDVVDSVCDEIIKCPNDGKQEYLCATAYRIIPDELLFYRNKNLPLPRYCPNCRHFQRLQFRNPFKLYTRSCMKESCNNTFKTTFSPDQPETIYCERCYQQEVY